MKSFVFLAGLPRTGSTLLTAILSQNPFVHAAGNSPVCQIMNDCAVSVTEHASEQIRANKTQEAALDIVRSVPHTYYKNIQSPIVLDKCRTWTLPANMRVIRDFITPNPRVIVLVRPVDEIIRSFIKLWNQNNLDSSGVEWLKRGSQPIILPLEGVLNASRNNNGEFLFVSYDQIINDTQQTIERIYAHCGWESFAHDFTNITNIHPEDDSVYGLIGQHEVRSVISREDNPVVLEPRLQSACDILNEMIRDLL